MASLSYIFYGFFIQANLQFGDETLLILDNIELIIQDGYLILSMGTAVNCLRTSYKITKAKCFLFINGN